MFRFLRVNMATKTCVFEEIPQEYAGLGGRALTSTIVAREVPPTCTPIGPHNKLVFAPGLLGATNSPNANRISVGCKSPLTEGIKESNAGGQPGGRHLPRRSHRRQLGNARRVDGPRAAGRGFAAAVLLAAAGNSSAAAC